YNFVEFFNDMLKFLMAPRPDDDPPGRGYDPDKLAAALRNGDWYKYRDHSQGFGNLLDMFDHAIGGEPPVLTVVDPSHVPDDSKEPIFIVRDYADALTRVQNLKFNARLHHKQITRWYP